MTTERYCAECGKLLRPKNQKYCSNDCFKAAKAKAKKIIICKTCGKKFTSPGKKERKYCSNECCGEDKRTTKVNTRPERNNELNRPFTSETPYLVNLWHNRQGDSFEQIAMILNRSVESVKEAYNMYVQEGLHATRIN